jgi:hypothetical protein
MIKWLRYFKIIFLAGAVLMPLLFFASAHPARALDIPDPLTVNNNSGAALPKYNAGVDQSIADYLCTPEGKGSDLFNCVNRLYRFSITAGSIAVVFFIVLAGYIYITGGESQKSKAKSILFSSLTGLGIILTSFVLLNFINPDLVRIKTIQPPIFTSADLPKCEEIGFSANCIISTGPSAGQVSSGAPGVAGSATEAQYKDLIAKYASANGLEYCHLSALMQKESTYNRYARSNPPGSINPSNRPPTYGQSFDVYHAIGLTQITIYPKAKGGWVGDTPARSSLSNFGKSPLTLEMLLDPETNISAGAKYFGQLYRNAKNNYYIAYDDFQSGPGDTGAPGKPDSDPKTLDKIVQLYTACKKRS